MTIVVSKRFAMDDVPCMLLPDDVTMEQAEDIYKGIALTYRGCPHKLRATPTDEEIAHTCIGTTLVAFLLVEFGPNGEAVRSVIVPVEA